MTETDGLLFDPNTYDPQQFDAETRRLLRATIDFFEGQGKKRLLDDDLKVKWPAEFVDFVKREKLFATFLTPAEFSGGDPNKRWDAARNAALSEILGFYGLTYWYTEQVTILGLGPIWQSENKDAKLKAADDLEAGEVMAFGLSERKHGADVYNTDMVLTPASEEDRADGILYRASGEKYYIGNGNVASMVSVFGRLGDPAHARSNTTGDGNDDYVFFAADSRHENYHLIDNVVHMQIYVSTFRLENYPVREEDILHTGVEAFAAALNTVNIGKFNLCTCSVGMVEHAFYEAITHAQNRILYGNPVTDFAHVRANFVDSYARLVAMKLFSQRAVDYLRSASLEDRRYLLFNPVTKAKVTMEGETILHALHDVVAAKGYEKNTMFREVAQLIGALPRLEGTVHVNVGLVLKFMPNYMLNPTGLSRDRNSERRRRRRVLLEPGAHARRGQGAVRRLDAGIRGAREHPERRAVLRAGQGVQAIPPHRRPGRRPTEGSGLPAQRRPLVLADRLRAADSRAGGADGRRRRYCGPDLRPPDSRLQHVCRRIARQAEFNSGTAGLGTRSDPQTGSRHRALRPGLGPGQGLRRRIRDAALTDWCARRSSDRGQRVAGSGRWLPTGDTAAGRWSRAAVPDRLFPLRVVRRHFVLRCFVNTNLANGICICSGVAASRSAIPASSRSRNSGDRGSSRPSTSAVANVGNTEALMKAAHSAPKAVASWSTWYCIQNRSSALNTSRWSMDSCSKRPDGAKGAMKSTARRPTVGRHIRCTSSSVRSPSAVSSESASTKAPSSGR